MQTRTNIQINQLRLENLKQESLKEKVSFLEFDALKVLSLLRASEFTTPFDL